MNSYKIYIADFNFSIYCLSKSEKSIREVCNRLNVNILSLNKVKKEECNDSNIEDLNNHLDKEYWKMYDIYCSLNEFKKVSSPLKRKLWLLNVFWNCFQAYKNNIRRPIYSNYWSSLLKGSKICRTLIVGKDGKKLKIFVIDK